VTFDAPRVTLGRSSECDIQLPYRVVSAHHLTFQRAGSHYRFRDEATTNGTELNGELLPPGEWVVLEDGSKLRVVDVVIECAVETSDAEVEAFTLAETGTMARKMLGDVLEKDTEDHAYFELVDGPHRDERFRIPDELESGGIGSGANCVVQLPDADLPARAAELSFEAGSFVITPISDARVTVGGSELREERPLRDGDRVSFAGRTTVFRDPLESHLMELEELGDAPASEGTTPPASGEHLEEASLDRAVVSREPTPEGSGDGASDGQVRGESKGETPERAGDEGYDEPEEPISPKWGMVETILLVVTIVFLLLAAAVVLVTFEVI